MNRKKRKLRYIRAKNKSITNGKKVDRDAVITSLDLPHPMTAHEMWLKGYAING